MLFKDRNGHVDWVQFAGGIISCRFGRGHFLSRGLHHSYTQLAFALTAFEAALPLVYAMSEVCRIPDLDISPCILSVLDVSRLDCDSYKRARHVL